MMTDHYDPRQKVLRLSEGVYNQPNLAAVGIAAHEAGHAIQDATRYWPLMIRNMAVPVASTGSGLGIFVLMIGLMLASANSVLGQWLVLAGMVMFGGVVFFQLVNLPVEFDASRRAKQELASHGIVSSAEMPYVDRVLGSAAWTYVAATLQSIMVLLYLLTIVRGRRSY